MSGRTPPDATKSRRPPRGVLAILTVVLVLGCTPLAVYSWLAAWTGWHTVPTDGVVADVRFVKLERTPPKSRGPWRVVWVVELDSGEPRQVEVTAMGSYPNEAKAWEASRHDTGRRLTVWHVEGEDGPGSLHPPDRKRDLFAALWSTATAAIGWLGVASFIQFLWRRRRGGRVETNRQVN